MSIKLNCEVNVAVFNISCRGRYWAVKRVHTALRSKGKKQKKNKYETYETYEQSICKLANVTVKMKMKKSCFTV